MMTPFISLHVPKCPVSNCHHVVSVIVIVVSSPFVSQTTRQYSCFESCQFRPRSVFFVS